MIDNLLQNKSAAPVAVAEDLDFEETPLESCQTRICHNPLGAEGGVVREAVGLQMMVLLDFVLDKASAEEVAVDLLKSAVVSVHTQPDSQQFQVEVEV